MKKIISIFNFQFFILAVGLLLTSCEVDFSPNAPWKEVPVVHCLLDQDDDTTWVRVEKCFLGEGNIYTYGAVSDSINYPKDSIIVRLLAFDYWGRCDTIPFTYTITSRRDGQFASVNQPLYYSTESLDGNKSYQLEVLHASSGRIIASTDRVPLIRQTAEKLIREPSNNDIFRFVGRYACHMVWDVMENARLYQPLVRFYYAENGDTLHVDLKCASIPSGNGSTILSCNYSRDAFLGELYTQLKDDPNPKQYLKTVDIFITACDENLNTYLTSLSSSSDNGREAYSNIHGGVGIFAARRTHLYRNYRADSSIISGSGYGLVYYLDSLDIGF